MKLAESKLEVAEASLARSQAALQQKEEELAAAQVQVSEAREAAAEAQADAQAAIAAAGGGMGGHGGMSGANPLVGQPLEVTHSTVGGWFADFLLCDDRWDGLRASGVCCAMALGWLVGWLGGFSARMCSTQRVARTAGAGF